MGKLSNWLTTLNVTDAPYHTTLPHCGSIGHVLPFDESCRLAAKYGFHAVNADRNFIYKNGPEAASEILKGHKLKAAAFAFSAAFNSRFSDTEFNISLNIFRKDLELCSKAGFSVCVGYIHPSSDNLNFHEHFRLLKKRLKQIKPMLTDYGVRLGLEFIGPTTNRIEPKHDFIHTLDGLRSLIASANAEKEVGIKFDSMHWYTSGAGILDIEKLSPDELVYVEINDGLSGDYTRFNLPEFERELPGKTGVIDLRGMLTKIHEQGYDGPLVVEPWNASVREMNPEDAIKTIKINMDSCMNSIFSSISGDLTNTNN